MAITYSDQYAAAYNTVPRTKMAPTEDGYLRARYWSYTEVAGGGTNDVMYVAKLPAGSRLILPMCAVWTVGIPADTVFDLGFLSYTEPDGDVVATSSDGLIDGIDAFTNGLWFGGMTVVATPDDLLPDHLTYWFNSREAVTITLTQQAGTALAAADIVQGLLTYINQ